MGRIKTVQASNGTNAGSITAIDGTVTAKSADYTITDIDNIRYIPITSGNSTITITLPTLADNQGRVLFFQKADNNTTGKAVIDGEGSETINGDTTVELYEQYQYLEIVAGPTEWIILKKDNTEYAYNSGTVDANDTSSFAYGQAGTLTGPLTNNRTKRVRFRTAVKTTDRIEIQLRKNASNAHWFALGPSDYSSGTCPLVYVSTRLYGAGFSWDAVASTDITVAFGQYCAAAAAGTYGATGDAWTTGYYWRVVKHSRI